MTTGAQIGRRPGRTRRCRGALDSQRQRSEPLAVGVRDDPGAATLTRLTRWCSYAGWVTCVPLNSRRVDLEQLGLADRLDDHDVEQPVVEHGPLAHAQPAAVRRPVADRDEHRVAVASARRRARGV